MIEECKTDKDGNHIMPDSTLKIDHSHSSFVSSDSSNGNQYRIPEKHLTYEPHHLEAQSMNFIPKYKQDFKLFTPRNPGRKESVKT